MSERHLASVDALPSLEKDNLRIYSMLYCPFAQRPRLVLKHKGIPFEVVNVNLKDKPSWFFERNPNGTVPILEMNDKVLYESGPVMDYIDEAFPGPKLTPSDPYIKAKGRVLGDEFGKIIGLYYKMMRSPTDEDRAEAVKTLHSQIEKFHSYMPETKFLTGDEVGMADYFCWPWIERFPLAEELFKEKVIPDGKFPKIHAWIAAMEETPGVKATRITLQDHSTFAKGYFSGSNFDYDFALKK